MESVIVNDQNISGYVTSFESYDEMDSDTIIGNAVSTQIKLTLNNRTGQLNDLMDYPFKIGNKTYIIYDKPEKWTKSISVTFYDLMIRANIAYDTKLDYPTTVSDQLDEMSQMMDVVIDKSTLSIELLSKEVNWYDNTLIIRNYLAFIAQCDGKNVFIEDDKIVFRKIALATYETNFCSDYELNEFLTFTRVCYDDGLNVLEKGNDLGKTMYVSTNNSYITQEDIDRIYDMYNGLSFYSFKKFNCKALVGLKLTDLVTYNDLTILPLSIKRKVYGGEARDSLEMSGDIALKSADMVVTKDDPIIRIKRIQTIVDQNNQQLQIIAQDMEDIEGSMAKLELNVNEISMTVSNTQKEVNEIVNKPVISVSTNLPTQQVLDQSSNTFIPDFNTQNMILTPVVKINDQVANLNNLDITWSKRSGNLSPSEVVTDKRLILTANVLNADKRNETYSCTLKYDVSEDDPEDYKEIQSEIELTLVLDGQKGEDGQDAIILQIISSNGNMFKNETLSTTLTITIIIGNEMITSSDQMYAKFGAGAYLVWEEKEFGQSEFTEIPSTDSRLSDNGFIMTLNPEDVYKQTVFNCYLYF